MSLSFWNRRLRNLWTRWKRKVCNTASENGYANEGGSTRLQGTRRHAPLSHGGTRARASFSVSLALFFVPLPWRSFSPLSLDASLWRCDCRRSGSLLPLTEYASTVVSSHYISLDGYTSNDYNRLMANRHRLKFKLWTTWRWFSHSLV